MHRIRWDDLQYVHAVAEHGTLSGASRALGVNHATVLRRIALLEETSDVKLFDRGKDGYRLRPEGRAILASLKLMDHASGRVSRSLAMTAQGVEGTFRVATTDAIACLLLPKYLEPLRALHPNIKIEIAASNNLIDLSLSGAEVLLRPGPSLPAELSGTRAGVVRFKAFAAPGYLADNLETESPEQKWLGVAPGFAQSAAGEWQFTELHSQYDFSADSFLTLAALAAQGLGLAMLPSFIGRNTPPLVQVPNCPAGPEVALWAATHKDFRHQADIRVLLDFFADAIRQDPDLKGE